MLWTEKYKPKKLDDVAGQTKVIQDILKWYDSWKQGERPILLYGPPGVGKTLIAEVLAKEKSLYLVQMNASDKRNADAIEKHLSEAVKSQPLFYKSKLILIDEVDGVTSEDRGGLTSLMKLIKKSRFPVIMTANDPYKSKLRTLRAHCRLIRVSRVNVLSIAKRLRDICKKEGIEVDDNIVKSLARWSSGDMRSAIVDLQTLCEGKDKVTMKDLEVLGFRERELSIFDILPTILRSKSIKAARQAIKNCDKDPDEIFWWIEHNISNEFKDPEELAEAYDLLSKADIFRQWVLKQQNWRFKAYMIDMLAGMSLIGGERHSFVQYKSPQKFATLANMKKLKEEYGKFYDKMVKYVHSSTRTVKNQYMPCLRFIISKGKGLGKEGLEVTEDEIELLRKS